MTERRQWYQIRNQANMAPEILIYGEIESFFGIDAGELVKDLAQISAPEILVRINSPGGDMFDAVAIRNALIAHPAKITAQVDSLAASAASIVAMGGDDIVMSDGSQLMLHNAWALVAGNADDMRKTADMLEKQNDVIAGIYASRAGGTVADWRAIMADETWLNAQEAVDAGLADRVIKIDANAGAEAQRVAASFDRSRYRYAGRQSAPAPQIAARTQSSRPKEGSMVASYTHLSDADVVESAINEGKIDASGRQPWLNRLKQDPHGFRALLQGMAACPGLNSTQAAPAPMSPQARLDAELAAVSAKVTGRQPQDPATPDLVVRRRPAARAALDDASNNPGDFVPRNVTDAELKEYVQSDPEYHRAVHAITEGHGVGWLDAPEPQLRVNAEIDAPWDPKPVLVVHKDGTGHWENQKPDPRWLGVQDAPGTQRRGPFT